MIARLYNARGGVVARVEVPPFETGFPPALLWGVRFFLLQRGSPNEGAYVETFCYVARIEVVDPGELPRDREDGEG